MNFQKLAELFAAAVIVINSSPVLSVPTGETIMQNAEMYSGTVDKANQDGAVIVKQLSGEEDDEK